VNNIIVFISGAGSNLKAIIDNAYNNNNKPIVSLVISNQPNAKGLVYAKNANIKNVYIKNDKNFEKEAQRYIDKIKPNLIVLAGFMRILNDIFVDENKDKLINIHPSLLPKYKGLNTHQRALKNKDKRHGATVHFVSKTLDSGKVIAQSSLDIAEDDDEKTLQKRVLKLEHKLYFRTILKLLEDKI
jgi:phosphoribosylglycinamide formyltransferase 1